MNTTPHFSSRQPLIDIANGMVYHVSCVGIYVSEECEKRAVEISYVICSEILHEFFFLF